MLGDIGTKENIPHFLEAQLPPILVAEMLDGKMRLDWEGMGSLLPPFDLAFQNRHHFGMLVEISSGNIAFILRRSFFSIKKDFFWTRAIYFPLHTTKGKENLLGRISIAEKFYRVSCF